MRENTERISNWVFDLDGELRLAVRSPESGDTQVLRVDEDEFTPLYVCGVFESCNPVRFHPDGERVYMVTNKGDDVDFIRLTLLDVESGAEQVVESDPEERVDLAAPIFSERTDELIATVYIDDRARIQIVVALRERGFPVEYILAPDEGHGFANPVNNMAAFAAAERFLAEHLDGRFQEGGKPEVVQRLREITVDPDTVELSEGNAPPR